MAAINHPNIIPVLEIGRIDERTLFIATAYITGQSLREKLQEEFSNDPQCRENSVEMVRQVGAALTHSHQQNIFHLGINPNCILFDEQEDSPRIFLTDFGFTNDKAISLAIQSDSKILLGTEQASSGQCLLDGKPIPTEPDPERGDA